MKTAGYQELGLSGKYKTSASGLAGSTKYYFKVAIDGGAITEYDITTGSDLTFGAICNLMEAACTSAIFDIWEGDFRVTSKTTGTSSAISLSAGSTGTNLWAALTGWSAFEAAVGGTDPGAYDLVTLADLRTFLDIVTGDGYDARLARLISAVSYTFNVLTNRILAAQDVTEYYDGDGTVELWVDNPPINSTASTISVYTCTDTPRDYSASEKISSDYIMIYSKEGRIVLDGDTFPAGHKTVKVAYNGGYTTVPYDLQQACLMTCAALWKKEKEKMIDLSNISVQGGSVSIIDQAMPAYAKEIIGYYRRDTF